MTYDDAMGWVIAVFCELPDEKQVDIMEDHLNGFGQDVDIFPMSQFDSYCKEKWGDRYAAFAEAMQNSEANDFDVSDLWCMYSKTENAFESAETPADFSYGDDELTETLICHPDFLRNEMNFSQEDIDEVADAYNEEMD